MGMEKKNPYVTTIGFNRKDPNYRKVAEFLNGMERGKAQYIVNAVVSYQDWRKEQVTGILGYEAIREIVKEILEDKKYVEKSNNLSENREIPEKYKEITGIWNLKEDETENIIGALDLFKKY